MTSIRDIATLAGASVTTVSRVINNSGYVSAETRARVEQAIAALAFTPNANARRMRSGNSLMVGVVLPALDVPFSWYFGACDRAGIVPARTAGADLLHQ